MKKGILIFMILLICIATAACSAKNEKNSEDVNTKNLNMKESYVSELTKEFNSSGTSEYAVDEAVKEQLEQRLGKTLPDDYYEFLNSFGHASFGEYLTVTDPFIPDGIEEYFSESDFFKEWYYDARAMTDTNAKAVKDKNGKMKVSGEPAELLTYAGFDENNCNDNVYSKLLCIGMGYPYDFLNNGSGLVFWGETDDCQFYWNFSGDDYTVVAFCDDLYYEYDMSFSEFLYHYLNGNIIGFEFDPDEEPYLYEELK